MAAAAVAKKAAGTTPSVTADDQKKINRFARLHSTSLELKAELNQYTNQLQVSLLSDFRLLYESFASFRFLIRN